MDIYLDNAATTPCSEAAAALVARGLTTDYGNPSSLHRKGVEAERSVRTASEEIARTLRCLPKEILFTSGGTESNNMAILGAAQAHRRRGRHIITTQVEHPSVRNTIRHLEEEGYEITWLPVNEFGEISTEALRGSLREDTILVSIMMVNNEIGAVEPVAEAGAIIHAANPDILFHVDAVQAYGKYHIHPAQMDIDLLSASGHKIYGPKGVGFLYIRDKARIRPTMYGGGQQNDLRSGTINAPGIAGMGCAAREVYASLDEDVARMRTLRSHFIEQLRALPDVTVNGRTDDLAAPHIVSASFAGVKSEVLLHALEEEGIYVSAGSACASNHPSDRTTLPAIGLTKAQQESTLRFSFSVHTTGEELDATVEAIAELLPTLRKYKHF